MKKAPFGWKGSMVIAVIWFIALFTTAWGDITEMTACLAAAAGWCGWALQEKEVNP